MPEHFPDDRGVSLVDDEPSILDVIAHGDGTTHPHALLLRSRDLVADALTGDLALELGEGQQHV